MKKEQKQNASSQEEGSVNDTNAEEYVPDLCDYDDAFGNDVPLDIYAFVPWACIIRFASLVFYNPRNTL